MCAGLFHKASRCEPAVSSQPSHTLERAGGRNRSATAIESAYWEGKELIVE
jgi:hypothetical protein